MPDILDRLSEQRFSRPEPPQPDLRKEFLNKGGPRVLGNGWVEFATSGFATRERRTRVMIDLKDLSSVEESYEQEKWGNGDWQHISLKNGKTYIVKATYDEMMDLIAKKSNKKGKKK